MKKIVISGICFLCALFAISCAATVKQQMIGDEGRWSFDGNSSTLYIEQEDACFDWIGQVAFDEIERIVFKASVRSIANDSFNNLGNLEEVILPDSLECIGNYAFMNDPKLQTIKLPKALSKIGIRSLDRINTIVLDPQNTAFREIDGIVFSEDYSTVVFASKGLTDVTLPDAVTTIEDGAFYRCADLESIAFPEALERIGLYAFMGCSALKSIQLPSSLSVIEDYAFADCTSITELLIPESTEFISDSDNAFLSGSGIKRLIFEGNRVDFCTFVGNEDAVCQVVCLSKPPEHNNNGITSTRNYTIYYFSDYKQYWAPNHETEWNGIAIEEIHSLDDLPSVKAR